MITDCFSPAGFDFRFRVFSGWDSSVMRGAWAARPTRPRAGMGQVGGVLELVGRPRLVARWGVWPQVDRSLGRANAGNVYQTQNEITFETKSQQHAPVDEDRGSTARHSGRESS